MDKPVTIEEIKWMCEKHPSISFIKNQDDDEYDEYYIGFKNGSGEYVNEKMYKTFVLPDLIQRAIEGVIESKEYFIDFEYYNDKWTYRIFAGDYPDSELFLKQENGLLIDQAKLSALRYIKEHEEI